ncbi:MAG: hypothetical protein ACI8QD_000560 [Cyclobacteriaceae bacterium]|jgi:hypothetical protein
MKPIKRIEVIISKRGAETLTKLLDTHKIQGYSRIKNVEGAGDTFSRDGDYPSDVFSNNCIIIGCSEDQFNQIKEELRILLTENSGFCMVSDANMLIH